MTRYTVKVNHSHPFFSEILRYTHTDRHTEIVSYLTKFSFQCPTSYRVIRICFLSSAVFTWTNLLVVVAELDGGENEALDLVPLVTNIVLEVA